MMLVAMICKTNVLVFLRISCSLLLLRAILVKVKYAKDASYLVILYF